ncbi:MAG: hypothetical protein ABW185_14610 [Sedimenticola sp.]
MLIRNIGDNLYNGLTGVVHHTTTDEHPVVNFNGKLISLETYTFDVYDSQQHKVIASRKQYPIMLAFSMTVHRAQGRTLPYVDVDCFSFFAAGQMGVAIGRAQSKSGLRVRNLNIDAARLRHPVCVYEFYDRVYVDTVDDRSCCTSRCAPDYSTCTLPVPSTSQEGSAVDSDVGYVITDVDMPQLQCPYPVHDFFTENENSTFVTCLTENQSNSAEMQQHINYLYYQIQKIFNKQLVKAPQWNVVFSELNNFLVSDTHIDACRKLFDVGVLSKQQNKLSTKLSFWLLDKHIEKKSEEVLVRQEENLKSHDILPMQHSAASKSKLRYLAGACVYKISNRLRKSVLRNIGKQTKGSRITRKFSYKKQAMLKQFRIQEDNAPQDDSMYEIQSKQDLSHGLFIVNDEVFNFFVNLNTVVQAQFSFEHYHMYAENMHTLCRNAVDRNDHLAEHWLQLFADCRDDSVEDEIVFTLMMELFRDVTEYFVRLAFVDTLKEFKRTIPAKKKQAIRSKVKALGEKTESHKRPRLDTESETDQAASLCKICNMQCEWEPAQKDLESVACDKCNGWSHYRCVGLTGNESFLTKEASTWFCSNCKGKGPGRRKGKRGK